MNYRKMFKGYYDIEFSSEFDVHHIDLNHENNDINNLMILPKELHQKYHMYLNAVDGTKFDKCFYACIHSSMINGDNYNLQMAQDLINVLYECNKWYDYKLYLEGKLPNLHGLEVF